MARWAISRTASSVKVTSIPSVPRSCRYCVREGALRLGEDADQVGLRERLELDANREAPLQLGNQIARLRDVEGSGGDEEDVVGAHRAELGLHRRALDDREDVALDALARDVGAVAALAPRYSCPPRR